MSSACLSLLAPDRPETHRASLRELFRHCSGTLPTSSPNVGGENVQHLSHHDLLDLGADALEDLRQCHPLISLHFILCVVTLALDLPSVSDHAGTEF